MRETEETEYDRSRLAGLSRRTALRLAGVVGAAVSAGPLWTGRASAASPIVKPLPADKFVVYGSNAEMRWESMSGQGELVPVDRFFVRDHTETPRIDAAGWRLKLWGSGLRGAPPEDRPVEFGYDDLRRLPSRTVTARIECAGNGRSFFTSQQGQRVEGTAWGLGAVGVARWRGVPLGTVLRRAGLTTSAVDILPKGLDREYVTGGVNLGRVRRPLPVRKALRDVLLAYEMNGEPLPPDHGFPVRLVVPDWIGISSIKWLGRIEVADRPLYSPWNTQYYRLVGPGYPAGGELVTRQNTKSAFELPWAATLGGGREHVLRGRSWSGTGRVRRVEVSTDGGRTWRHTTPMGAGHGWQRWAIPWRPPGPGSYTVRARATDSSGVTQPDVAPYNTQGYLFGAVVAHPVTVT
ncbi:sulfite oxidase [Amycolatopsis sp. NPDC059021]|uniref:sulfite oxidase n=1 Tax=Amycolatopsis sp. NPDC059021 TaxID=3346704 RepID=UPI0036700A8F